MSGGLFSARKILGSTLTPFNIASEIMMRANIQRTTIFTTSLLLARKRRS